MTIETADNGFGGVAIWMTSAPEHVLEVIGTEWDAFLAAVRAPVEKERDDLRQLAEDRGHAVADYGRACDQLQAEAFEARAQLAAAMRVVDAARAYATEFHWIHDVDEDNAHAIPALRTTSRYRLIAAVDEFDQNSPASPPESTLPQDQASGDHADTPASENADEATGTTEGAWVPLAPPIPAEVYRRTHDDDHKEPDDRVACAVETGWVAAWHAAKGITDDDD